MNLLIPLEVVKHREIWGGVRETGVTSHPAFSPTLSIQKQQRFPW